MGTNVNKKYKKAALSTRTNHFEVKFAPAPILIIMTETLMTLTANGRAGITQILADINQISRDINQTIHNSLLHALFPKP